MKNVTVKQKGFTLAELAVVVAIIGLLLLGLKGVPRIMASYRANEEIANLPKITTNIQKHFYNDADYSTLSMSIVVQYQLVPNDMIVGGNTVDRWGGGVGFYPTASYATNDSAQIVYGAVPEYECREIVKGVEENYLSILVNGTVVKPLGGTLNDSTLGTACVATNTLVFIASK